MTPTKQCGAPLFEGRDRAQCRSTWSASASALAAKLRQVDMRRLSRDLSPRHVTTRGHVRAPWNRSACADGAARGRGPHLIRRTENGM